MLLHLLIPLVSLTPSVLAVPSPPREQKRQDDIFFPPSSEVPTPTTTATATATATETAVDGQSPPGGKGLALEVIIPVVVLLASAVLLVIFVHWRAPIREFFKATFAVPTNANALQPSSTRGSERRTLTAEQLSGRPDGTHTDADAGESANVSARERRRRERARNIRRTESGRSVRTLPVYSKEAGDEELVLVRQRSQSSFSDESYSDQDIVDAERGLLTRSGSVRSTVLRRRDEGPGDDPPLSTVRENEEQPYENLLSPLPGSLEEGPPGSPESGRDGDEDSVRSAPPATSQSRDGGEVTDNTPRRSDSIIRRGWGEAPTYLEAMSTPLFPPTPSPGEPSTAGVPPPRTLRTRTSSTFRGLLSRAGFTGPFRNDQGGMSQRERSSSTSLLLQPTTSRLSATSSFRPTSPQVTPMTSTLSLISSPLPNTVVRASFDSTHLPRAGLSDDQMRFLGSKEALSVAGMKLGDVPDGRKRRRRSEAISVDLADGSGSGSRRGSVGSTDRRVSEGSGASGEVAEEGMPPSWEQSEELRRRNEAYGRRNLSRPVGGEGDGPEPERATEADTEEENGLAFAAEAGAEASGKAAVLNGAGPGREDGAWTGGEDMPVDDSVQAGPSAHRHLEPLRLGPTSESGQMSAAALALASTPTPQVEIEPPTPTVGIAGVAVK